jgi:hypothetical protein
MGGELRPDWVIISFSCFLFLGFPPRWSAVATLAGGIANALIVVGKIPDGG